MERNIKEKYQRPLVVLRGVYDYVLNSKAGCVLFGENQCIEESGKLYDLIFHISENVPINRLEQIISLVVPVIDAQEKDCPELQIYDIHKKHPWIDLFAVKYNELCFDKSKYGTKLSPKLLKFWEIKNVTVGKAVQDIGEEWKIVNEKDLIRISKNPQEFADFLKEKRKLINQNY